MSSQTVKSDCYELNSQVRSPLGITITTHLEDKLVLVNLTLVKYSCALDTISTCLYLLSSFWIVKE
jgi:hypothetical protein